MDKAIEHGQRALVGKVNMIRLAPDDYIESPEASIKNTLRFIEEVKSKGCALVKPIITPRFALSVDMEHMVELGEIAQAHDLHIQVIAHLYVTSLVKNRPIGDLD